MRSSKNIAFIKGVKTIVEDINEDLQKQREEAEEEERELFDDNFGDEADLNTDTPTQESEQKETPEQPLELESKKESIATGIEERAKFKEQILSALGFTKYDNGEEGRKYSLLFYYKGIDIKLGKTFKLNGSHYWWCFPKDSTIQDKEGMKNAKEIAKIPIVHLYNDILNGISEIPAKTIIGHVHKRHGKSVVIEFESPEAYEEKGASFGEGAIKFDVDGKFIPASFSAATKNQPAKMKVPRIIRLPSYETEMDSAPKTEKKGTTNQQTSSDKLPELSGEETELGQHIVRMQLAVRAAVQITLDEVEGKLENQGLAGFVKDIALTLFREPRLEEGSKSPRQIDEGYE